MAPCLPCVATRREALTPVLCVRVRVRVWPPQSLSVRRGMILRLAAAAAVARARVQALEGAKLSQQVCGAPFHHTTSTYARV